MAIINTVSTRLQLALTTWPTGRGWMHTIAITSGSTILAGMVATATGFVNPIEDVKRPTALKVLSAFIFPALLEELFWRAAALPHPSIQPITAVHAVPVLMLHVLWHPVIGELEIWPRGRVTFSDPRFLALAVIVLGGATASYIVTGGSVYAAAFAHGVPVALWIDFFGGLV